MSDRKGSGGFSPEDKRPKKPGSFSHPLHPDLSGHYQFITFRTKESLDRYLINLYRSDEPKRIRQYKMDRYLDRSVRGAFLHGELIEEIRDYYLSKEPGIFEVEALTIMPNHIHILLLQKRGIIETIRILKGGAAYIVNRRLGRKGKVWSRDYYDRAVRDEEHYRRVYEYIRDNASKAGLPDAHRRFYGRYD